MSKKSGISDALAKIRNPLLDALQEFLRVRQFEDAFRPPYESAATFEEKNQIQEVITQQYPELAAKSSWWQQTQKLNHALAHIAELAALQHSPKNRALRKSALIEHHKKIIKAFRDENDLTAPGLARRASMSEDTIRGIVREDRSRFAIASRDKLLKIMKVSLYTWNNVQ